MSTLLQINSSIWGDHGQSSQLANTFVATWLQQYPNTQFIKHDFATESISHLTAHTFTAFTTPATQRTAEQHALVAPSDAFIHELQTADIIVLSAPLYNFDIPSTLKAYFDHIARAGITFRYTEQGPQGLLNNKKLYIIATKGGKYVDTPSDTHSLYLKNFWAFLGVHDIEFIYAEQLAMGDGLKQQQLTNAHNKIQQLAA